MHINYYTGQSYYFKVQISNPQASTNQKNRVNFGQRVDGVFTKLSMHTLQKEYLDDGSIRILMPFDKTHANKEVTLVAYLDENETGLEQTVFVEPLLHEFVLHPLGTLVPKTKTETTHNLYEIDTTTSNQDKAKLYHPISDAWNTYADLQQVTTQDSVTSLSFEHSKTTPLENDDIIITVPKEHMEAYNAIINLLNASGVFTQVYHMLEDSEEYFKIKVSDKLKNPRAKGLFVRASNQGFSLGFIDFIDKAGEKDNPHYINLKKPDAKGKWGLTPSTVYEELFHAAQYLFNPNNRNKKQIETEAKVAKNFDFYNLYREKALEFSTISDFGFSRFEIAFLINNPTSKTSNFNKIVKQYFDAILNGKEIDEQLESQFRIEVIKFSNKVEELYKKYNWKGKKYNFNGDTLFFDKLIKNYCIK